jgi:plastocyanin
MFNQIIAAKQGALVALIGLALFAGGCGRSSSPSPAPSNPNPDNLVTIFITNGVYSPNPLTVKMGQRVNWKNNDAIPHTATLAGAFAFDTGSIAPMSAADVPVAMNIVGTFTFHCSLHAGETGTIIVQP